MKEQQKLEFLRMVYCELKSGNYSSEHIDKAFQLVKPQEDAEYKTKAIRKYYLKNRNKITEL